MEKTRLQVNSWRKVMANNPEDYTGSLGTAAVALLDATDAALAVADAIDHPGHYQNAEHAEVCDRCAYPWPCAGHKHATQIRQAVEEHTRNLP